MQAVSIDTMSAACRLPAKEFTLQIRRNMVGFWIKMAVGN